MKKYKSILILINLMVLLVVFNYAVVQKENLLKNSQLILLELAPVDPRSLMQGDYMSLRYKLSSVNEDGDNLAKSGYGVIQLDEKGIAHKIRFQKTKAPINDGELILKYTKSQWSRVSIGAESFFFQEGDAAKYEKAKFGGLKVDEDGNSVLVGLYDQNLQKIE